MCGIIGYVGHREAAPILLEGLLSLEYRGYDSAGIAVAEQDGSLSIHKGAGKLRALIEALEDKHPAGHAGIGHTRWATHGKANDINAHPHTDCNGDIVVIHNGIVENYRALKQRLTADGHNFRSETDTEVIPHLLESYMRTGCSLREAAQQVMAELSGAHALVIMSRNHPGLLVAARIGNAGGVAVGFGENETFVASDLPPLLPHTRRIAFLADHELAEITPGSVAFFNGQGQQLPKEPSTLPYDPLAAAKGNHKHFMLKEIMEQPDVIMDSIRGRVNFEPPAVDLEDIPFTRDQIRRIQRVVLVGMGTSLHAAMIGRYYMEQIAGLPAEYDNASEFRYRHAIIGPETLLVSVSQSGETVDTLAAMAEASQHEALQATIANAVGSQASRLAQGVVYTRCGLEIGVCSTKTFIASLVALYLLACHLGRERAPFAPWTTADIAGPAGSLALPDG